MRFTTAVVSILVGSAFAAPTEMSAEMKADTASDMSADAIAALSHMRLSDIFSERQLAVLKVLSEHKHELGLDDKEAEMMDTFMGALHETFHLNDKRQIATPAAPPSIITNATDAAGNATNTVTGALGNPGGVIDPLNVTNTNATTGAVGTTAGTITNATTGALTDSTALLNILKSIPALGNLFAGTTGGLGGATSGLTGATSGLGGLTGGLGGLTGGLGGLTGGLGGSTGGLGGLTGGLGGLCGPGLFGRGLLGGILIPGIL
ncbi:hypothetical protein N5P37_011658 [Trichoderma harzianum]|nr:hypothetical protein N5P37_011658 [Trichoderma harzianum]PKK44472.1 hypothetical protein CI102_9589 [Trichoderma harzianum]